MHYFIEKNLQLKHAEFLLRLTTTMLETTCRDWFRQSKNNYSNNYSDEDKNALAHRKSLNEELEALLHEDLWQTLAELAESLGVDHTTVSRY